MHTFHTSASVCLPSFDILRVFPALGVIVLLSVLIDQDVFTATAEAYTLSTLIMLRLWTMSYTIQRLLG
jgi:hypothetical protein